MNIMPHFFSSDKAKQPSLLCLRGEDGDVACRVHDPQSTGIFSQRSKWGRKKDAWLAAEKMGNLTAVRGNPGSSMVGPADYFGDLERSDQYFYTIDIKSNGVPIFKEHAVSENEFETSTPERMLSENDITTVKAQWIKGSNKQAMQAKMQEYDNTKVVGGNLFPNSGILEIDGQKEITLSSFNPIGVDLSEFKARLVPNNKPFQITAQRLHVDDEYCAVSYQYDADYVEQEVEAHSGMFLEHHQFAQTMTPLYPDSKGFVTLAKWKDSAKTMLDLIGIEIPFGYTLIIERGCIHGDTSLNGLFLMCMTSDHVSMATADTVFLKNTETKSNIKLKLEGANWPYSQPIQPKPLTPHVVHKANRSQALPLFKQRTRDMDFIFTPTPGYWRLNKEKIIIKSSLIAASACIVAAIPLALTMSPLVSIAVLSVALDFLMLAACYAGKQFFESRTNDVPELTPLII